MQAMENGAIENKIPELLSSDFKFHDFATRIGEVRISGRIIKMEDSLFIWIGDFDDCTMNDLSIAMATKYEKLPVATRLMGSSDEATSTSLAKRLTKKCGKPVYVSFNLVVNKLMLSGVEKALQDEFNAQKDLFAF